MSNNRTRWNESLVGGSGGEAEGSENAAASLARGFTRSGVSYAATDDLGSKQSARTTGKSTSEWKTDAETDKTVHGSKSQFSGASSGSRTRPSTVKRATRAISLEYTNSARKRVQSPKRVSKPALTKQQRQLDEVREKMNDLANRQHHYAQEKMKATKR